MAAASATRYLNRLSTSQSSLISSPLRSTTLKNLSINHQRQLLRPINQSSRRTYSSTPPPKPSHIGRYVGLSLVAVAGGAGYYVYATDNQGAFSLGFPGADGIISKKNAPTKTTQNDYQAVYNAIAHHLAEKDDYDDGSYGPVLVRLAWHCSGTYDAETKTGGSNGATMRFDPESDHGANAGLKAARDFLEPVKEQFSWISYSDLWTLAGVCAIQQMQGPTVPWRPGRADRTVVFCTPDGRLPDGSKEQSHLRAIFSRMGFNDQEIVALSGAHALGRCHTDRSGFDGPWTFSPTVVTNDYYKLLLDEKWSWKNWNGPKQYQDNGTKTLMMLPTDMALVKDKEFKKHVERYAKDNEVFLKEFSDVITKLFELGVPFTTGEDTRLTLQVAE